MKNFFRLVIIAVSVLCLQGCKEKSNVPRFDIRDDDIFSWSEGPNVVIINLEQASGRELEELSGQNLEKMIEIYVDDELVMSPLVHEKMSGQNLYIATDGELQEKLVKSLPEDKRDGAN